jgi:succinate dehydrogenase/fumarate reductase flavoprotein subunit
MPIPGLFSAGELGSIWAALYPGAGNVTETVVFGRIAGRSAATS